MTATTAAAAPGIVHVSGTLKNNTTWSPAQASTYIIDSTVDVPKGVSLTIEPGTIVKALNDTIMVEGKLSAVGTAANPIVFTSVNDNSAGGNTGTGSPAAGDWTGITSDGAGSLDIEHASVNYTSLAVDATGSGSLTVTSDTFSTSQGGVWADGPAAPVITGNTFTSPGGEAVGVVTSGTPTVEGNSVTSPHGTAFAVDAAISPALLAGDTVSGGPSSFELAGQITVSGTLPPLNVPWQVGDFDGVTVSDSGCLDVPAAVTLTISPGTIIKGDSGGFGSLCPGNGTSAIMVWRGSCQR